MRRLTRIVAPAHSGSLGNRMRRRRFELFKRLLSGVPVPIRVLDVGGREGFWEQMRFTDVPNVELVLLNREPQSSERPNVTCERGDARSMPQYEDGEFDVAFSNSVIEHVGGWRQQQMMADEITRVGRRFFVQTPNFFFPIEPHFLVPGFQFLPVAARVALVRRISLGYPGKIPSPDAARAAVEGVQLLRKSQIGRLFPGATIHEEHLVGLTKSFIALGGWEVGQREPARALS